MIDQGYTQNVVIIDDNHVPVSIDDLQEFLKEIVDQYYRVTAEYHATYSRIKSKRKVEDLINL